MNEIDYIMSLISWDRDIVDQKKGIEKAKEVENINVFLQPRNRGFDKNVWDNCALILADRTDEELSPYLFELLSWLQDMNWPGAYCILNRLNKIGDKTALNRAYIIAEKLAKVLDDNVWCDNLSMVNRNS